ncbi:MAG: nuclear transport factor 2 family protein [Psychroserpens sp.]|uniref:nuclear transport factor 2 family protein n=1 Tax=Psychroserpens sp. TaxID=2020870 RepID=UPI003002FF89
MSAKEVVKAFYELDLAKANNALDFIHPDCKLLWNSSNGYTSLDYDGIKTMIDDLKKSYHSFSYRISHLLEDQNTVTTRYTVYVTPIERPEKEDALAHFISIWEVKDGKLYRCHEISQLADDSSESLNSYSEIKV